MAFWDTVLNAPADASPYGRRLIPKLVDENARIKPERACFSIPRSDNLADGFRDISWREVRHPFTNPRLLQTGCL